MPFQIIYMKEFTEKALGKKVLSLQYFVKKKIIEIGPFLTIAF